MNQSLAVVNPALKGSRQRFNSVPGHDNLSANNLKLQREQH
jgi:hypothetical protein